jgi:hypothetical protein
MRNLDDHDSYMQSVHKENGTWDAWKISDDLLKQWEDNRES